MSRPSRREMRELAKDREKCADRCEKNAESAQAAAADTSRSFRVRRQAAATVSIALRRAQEYREEAAALREGRIPGEDW